MLLLSLLHPRSRPQQLFRPGSPLLLLPQWGCTTSTSVSPCPSGRCRRCSHTTPSPPPTSHSTNRATHSSSRHSPTYWVQQRLSRRDAPLTLYHVHKRMCCKQLHPLLASSQGSKTTRIPSTSPGWTHLTSRWVPAVELRHPPHSKPPSTPCPRLYPGPGRTSKRTTRTELDILLSSELTWIYSCRVNCSYT